MSCPLWIGNVRRQVSHVIDSPVRFKGDLSSGQNSDTTPNTWSILSDMSDPFRSLLRYGSPDCHLFVTRYQNFSNHDKMLPSQGEDRTRRRSPHTFENLPAATHCASR